MVYTYRRHPAVLAQPAKVFVAIAQALEVGALPEGGAVLAKVVPAAKALLAETNTDPMPLLQQFSPESQQTILKHFS
jgi:importin-5